MLSEAPMSAAAEATTRASPFEAPSARTRDWTAALGQFLLVGGLTPIWFFLAWLLRRSIGLDASDYAFGFATFYAAYVVNDPHFAVTYLLFYKDYRVRAFGGAFGPVQRARYVFAGVIAPLGLGTWAIAALATKSAFALGLMIQLMFLLVGWHYVKQGFGVMTCSRRGAASDSAGANGWRSSRTVSRVGLTRGRAPTIPAKKSKRRASCTRRSPTRMGWSPSRTKCFSRPPWCSSSSSHGSGGAKAAYRSSRPYRRSSAASGRGQSTRASTRS
jgi:hypothetical protein